MKKKKKKIIDKRLINLQTKVNNNLNKLSDFDSNFKLDYITPIYKKMGHFNYLFFSKKLFALRNK